MSNTIEILMKARKSREMTLKELSEKSGVSLGTVNKLFSGAIASVKVSTANKLAVALGLSPEDLISQSLDLNNNEVPVKKQNNYGFVKCAVLTNEVSIGNVDFNVEKTLELLDYACNKGVKLAVFPELNLTSYTAADLLYQEALLTATLNGISRLLRETARKEILYFVGAPLRINGRIYNTAVAICKGEILAVIPKTNLPNYNEFYEKRHFTPAPKGITKINVCGQEVAFGSNIILQNSLMPEMRIACEICEDIWVPNSPSISHSIAGATIIANLSTSNETVGKMHYRKNMVNMHTSKCLCAYLYTSSGKGESTTDCVFGGHNFICEAGRVLAESKPFGEGVAVADVDCAFLDYERSKKFTSIHVDSEYLTIPFALANDNFVLERRFEKTPFVPVDKARRDERCEDALSIQAHGLLKRINHINCKKLLLGISGGLDSTLAMIVAIRALKLAGRKPEDLVAITMPCFGTSKRTLNNAKKLCAELKCSFLQIDITESVKQHLKDLGHDGVTPDVTYENAQARERTQVLMDYANKVGGIVVGTGDMSELALGWATYNGDHMSMYSVNSSVPKTLVKEIVLYYGENSNDRLKEILFDIADTPISPELTPLENGEIKQSTEGILGPYVAHDFFMYYILKHGFSPSKVYYLAKHTFKEDYTSEQIATWLKTFIRRFFSQQFKRSCLPDGPKVGALTLSPRGNWHMPSDAVCKLWLDELQATLDAEKQ